MQPIKACGVTFIVSLLERLVEELAHGDSDNVEAIRENLDAAIIDQLREMMPGSPEAMKLREHLLAQNAWSQYLEVGLGKDPEIFTKAPPMSALGNHCIAGLLEESEWNNPEPEIVLAINSAGKVIGNCWPTIIEASFDPVDFITTLRTMFMSIKMAFGVESEALRISVSNGIQFWSGVW